MSTLQKKLSRFLFLGVSLIASHTAFAMISSEEDPRTANRTAKVLNEEKSMSVEMFATDESAQAFSRLVSQNKRSDVYDQRNPNKRISVTYFQTTFTGEDSQDEAFLTLLEEGLRNCPVRTSPDISGFRNDVNAFISETTAKIAANTLKVGFDSMKTDGRFFPSRTPLSDAQKALMAQATFDQNWYDHQAGVMKVGYVLEEAKLPEVVDSLNLALQSNPLSIALGAHYKKIKRGPDYMKIDLGQDWQSE